MTKLEVVVFTYNHEPFIERTLASVLAQNVDFDISIRIHDDVSTDGTVEAIHRALAGTDIPWRVVQPPANRYADGTSFYHEFIAASEAQYAAVLDGDDYWIDEDKLQSQVDLLDAAPDAALCHHRVLEDVGGRLTAVEWPPPPFRERLIPGSMLSVHNVISSSSVVVRTSMFPKRMPGGYNELGIGDYPMWALAAAGHQIGFIDRAMSAYRVHETNIFASLGDDTRLDRELEARIYISNHLPEEFRAPWREGIVAAIKYHHGMDALAAVRAELAERTAELERRSAELLDAQRELAELRASTSWRITAPLRAMTGRVRR